MHESDTDAMAKAITGSGGSGLESEHALVAEALRRLAVCSRSVGLYGRSHPLIHEMAEAAHEALGDLLDRHTSVSIAVADSYFAIDSFPLEDNNGSLTAFATLLHRLGVGSLGANTGATAGELVEFADVLSLSPEDLAARGGIRAELNRHGVIHVRAESGGILSASSELRDPAIIYDDALTLAEEAMNAVRSGQLVPAPDIKTVVSDVLRSVMDNETMVALAGIRTYDRYLSEHSVNVCIMSMIFGRDLGLDAAASHELGVAAMLHDVGKVFISPDIIKKPQRLTEQEWEHVRQHPVCGARELVGMSEVPLLAPIIAMQHHTRPNGTGYPSLPPGQKPYILSRLVAIVDSLDALITDRPYRKRWTPQEALGWMLYEAPGQYDRQLLARFAARAGLYPIGCMVRLRNGRQAVVVGGDHLNPDRPIIRLMSGEEKKELSAESINLSETDDAELEIRAVAQPVEALMSYTDALLAAAEVEESQDEAA